MSDAEEAAHALVSDYFYRTRKTFSLGEHSELCAAVAALLTETRTKALEEAAVTAERFYMFPEMKPRIVVGNVRAILANAIRGLKAEGGEI